MPLDRVLRPEPPIDVRLTLGWLRRGPGDPTMRVDGSTVWRATRAPSGPATMRVAPSDGAIHVRAWGPGASWVIEHAPAITGCDDDPSAFAPTHPLIAALHRRFGGFRIPRSGAVFEALVPTVLEQKVAGVEARRSYRSLVWARGEDAPGPLRLRVPPTPSALADLTSWDWHRLGVERKRADTIRRAAEIGDRLETTRDLVSLRGIGPWTAAEVALVALGDADAVITGDYHLPHLVSHALTGVRRSDDDRMLELLEPFRGHRGRVQRLLAMSGLGPRRRAPRARLREIASI